MKYGEDNESEVHWSEDRESSGMRMRENTRNIKKTYVGGISHLGQSRKRRGEQLEVYITKCTQLNQCYFNTNSKYSFTFAGVDAIPVVMI